MELNAYSAVIEKFVKTHAGNGDAVFHAMACRALCEAAWSAGKFDLPPAAAVDHRAVAKAIELSTGRRVRRLVLASASGADRDRSRSKRHGDVFRLFYAALAKGEPSLRLSRIIAERHGVRSGRYLGERTAYLLGMIMHESGLNARLRQAVRAGYGGALVERLAKLPDVGPCAALNDAFVGAIWYVMHGCIMSFLRYAMAGDDEGTFALLPLLECFAQAMPLAELAGDPGSWLVLTA
ncbi:MAG TPA: hypothetical protein VL426_00785 [Candidatus Binatia bacterium]|nr:hypothetical protein [Candidatus Binatia bacterium]